MTPRHDRRTYRKDAVDAVQLPSYEETIAIIRDYLAKSHLSIRHLAFHMGYSGQTLDRFLQGRYTSAHNRSPKLLTKVFLEFIANNPPGQIEEPRGRMYETENVMTIRKWFEYCQQRGKMACIYGGPGSQKTFIAEHLVAEQQRDDIIGGRNAYSAFYVYCSQDIRPAELIRKLLEAAAIPVTTQLQRNMAALRFAMRDRNVIFVFDEAQHLSIPCLEIIRELNDQRPHFGILLLGSHNLRNMFITRAGELEQWNSRIAQAIELPGIGEEAAAEIVRKELGDIAMNDGKVTRLLKSCMVADSYSSKKQSYLSVRKLFNSLDVIKEQAALQGRVN